MGYLVLIFGIFIGSFLNVCIYRIPLKQSIVLPPSSCPKCDIRIHRLDLLPLISWILLRGRCKYCSNRISLRYPLIELLTGLSFWLVYSRYGFNQNLLPFFILTGILIVSSFTDLDSGIVPNEVNLFGLASHILLNYIIDFISFKEAIIGSLIGGVFLFLLVIITKGTGMGIGDVKLMAVAGLYLGSVYTVVALFFAFITGAIVGISLLVFKRYRRNDTIPFAPFISIGSFVAIIWGSNILNFYMKVFL